MMRLFPFYLSMPAGIEYAVLLLFLFIGLVNILNLFLSGRARIVPLACIHILGAVLAVFASDLVSLLLAWEILTLSAFFLIRRSGSAQSRQASLRYFTVQIFSAALFFMATVLQYQHTGSLMIGLLTPASQPFIIAAVLVKTASMPMHFWLTESYPAADPDITALLSGFATKIGVLSAVRLVHFSVAGIPVLGLAGACTALIAVFFALRQQNARNLLSFHIVSQVGYMTAAAGMSSVLEGNAALLAGTAAVFHLITHTLYKSLLIMTANAARRSFGHEYLQDMGALMNRRPVLFFSALVGSLAIAGFPFTSGFASKELIKQALGSGLMSNLLVLASIGTALSFIKFMYLIFLRNDPGRCTAAEPDSVGSSDFLSGESMRMLPVLLLVAATLLIGFFPDSVPGLPAHDFFSLSSLLHGIAPISVAVILWPWLRRVLTTSYNGSKNAQASGTAETIRDRRLSTPLSLYFSRLTWPLRHGLRILHAVDPQAQMKLMLLTLCVVVVVLL